MEEWLVWMSAGWKGNPWTATPACHARGKRERREKERGARTKRVVDAQIPMRISGDGETFFRVTSGFPPAEALQVTGLTK